MKKPGARQSSRTVAINHSNDLHWPSRSDGR